MHNNNNDNWAGIIPAVASPCDDRDRFLEDTFSKLVTSLWQTGINGLYVCGNTGDGFKMRLEERKRAAQIAVELSQEHQGKVIIHVGSTNSRDAMELSGHAAGIGASAVSSIPLRNATHSQQLSYYTDIAGAAQIPVLVYHIPILTGNSSTVEEMVQLLDIPGVIGLKLTDWNLFYMKRLLLARPQAIVFNGFDEFLLPGLLYGARGGIGTSYNLFPQLFVEIYNNCRQGNIDRALELQNHFIAFCDLGWKYGIPPIFEHLMRKRGFGPYCFRQPRWELSDEVLKSFEPELDQLVAAIEEALKAGN